MYSPIIHTVCFSQTLIHGISDHKEWVSTIKKNQVGCSPISFYASSITARANLLVKGSARFLVVFIYSTASTPICLKCLTVLIHHFICLVDFKFSFALPTIVTMLSLSQSKRITGTNLLTTSKSMSNSRNHSTSLVAVSSATSFVSIVDFVRLVYLWDLQETVAPPIVNTYPLVTLVSSTSEIQFVSLYPSSTSGYPV
jgi:hypothetical protein